MAIPAVPLQLSTDFTHAGSLMDRVHLTERANCYRTYVPTVHVTVKILVCHRTQKLKNQRNILTHLSVALSILHQTIRPLYLGVIRTLLAVYIVVALYVAQEPQAWSIYQAHKVGTRTFVLQIPIVLPV